MKINVGQLVDFAQRVGVPIDELQLRSADPERTGTHIVAEFKVDMKTGYKHFERLVAAAAVTAFNDGSGNTLVLGATIDTEDDVDWARVYLEA